MATRRLSMAVALIFASSCQLLAARIGGEDLDYSRFKATIEFDDDFNFSGTHYESGTEYDGTVKFKFGRKATFSPDEGDDFDIKVRLICADGTEDDLDDCWPRLKIETNEMDDVDGILRVKAAF